MGHVDTLCPPVPYGSRTVYRVDSALVSLSLHRTRRTYDILSLNTSCPHQTRGCSLFLPFPRAAHIAARALHECAHRLSAQAGARRRKKGEDCSSRHGVVCRPTQRSPSLSNTHTLTLFRFDCANTNKLRSASPHSLLHLQAGPLRLPSRAPLHVRLLALEDLVVDAELRRVASHILRICGTHGTRARFDESRALIGV